MNPIKVLLAGLAFLCVGIGVLGIFIPVLPTVPMFILAAFLFERSSDKLHNWFKGTRLYQRYLQNFMEHRSMTLRGKLTILIPVNVLLIVTGFLVNNWIAWVILIVLILIMQWYFWTRITTVSPEQKAAEEVEGVRGDASLGARDDIEIDGDLNQKARAKVESKVESKVDAKVGTTAGPRTPRVDAKVEAAASPQIDAQIDAKVDSPQS